MTNCAQIPKLAFPIKRGRREFLRKQPLTYHRVLATSRNFMNAINFPCFDSDSAWFSARRVIGIVPPGRAWYIVAGPDAILGLCFGRAEVRRNHFPRIVAYAVDDELFNATQTRCTAAGVAFVAPWVRFPGYRRLYFYLIVVEPVSVASAIWIIVAAISVRTWLFEAPSVR